MSRIVVPLFNDEKEALIRLASLMLRTPSDQAHFMLRKALIREGLISELAVDQYEPPKEITNKETSDE